MNKIWEVKKRIFDDEITQLLFNRGIIDEKADKKAIGRFLDPDFNQDFYPAKLLPDYDKFLKRIKQAIGQKEKIGIFADYDADGIPGAALFYRALIKLGLKPLVYIPSRQEGYGLSKQGIDYLIDKEVKLIITIDLGIREYENADYIKSRKCDLIITDHHLPDEKLPNALAVINPKNSGSKYPFQELAGGGVAYKLVQGLSEEYPKELTESFLKWNLDLAAISTISDVVPMIDENRIIAKYGLISLAKTKNLGLKSLYEVAAINTDKLGSYTVGFQIAPRINAPGRMAHASKSFELLITEDKGEAETLSKWLNDQNSVRQEAMDQVQEEASKKIITKKLAQNKIIVVSGVWGKGVIGPTASRLVEQFGRPVIILSQEGDYLSGSSRSIKGFNIVDALENSSKYLLGFGGHKGAAGLQLKAENLEGFSKNIISYAEKKISDEDLIPRIEIDLEIEPQKIKVDLLKNFLKLEPFGLGNPRPVLLTNKLKLVDYRFVGKENKHLKLNFESESDKHESMFFNFEDDIKDLKIGHAYDIVFTPEINTWNGDEKPSLNIVDYRKSDLTY